MIDTVRTIGSSTQTIRASIIAIAILRTMFILFLGVIFNNVQQNTGQFVQLFFSELQLRFLFQQNTKSQQIFQ